MLQVDRASLEVLIIDGVSLSFADYMVQPGLESLEVPHPSLDPLVGLLRSNLQSCFAVFGSNGDVFIKHASSMGGSRRTGQLSRFKNL